MLAQKTSAKGWAIVALLFGFMMINFADKVIVGLAGVPIMTDLQLTPKQFGLVGSSFFFSSRFPPLSPASLSTASIRNGPCL